jgi:ribosomal protein S18 acetylase RimI-like enzyme
MPPSITGRSVASLAWEERASVPVGRREPLSLAATSHLVRLTIAVHEGHQRHGVGRALMNELLRWARSNPRLDKVELQVRSSNERAIALYRSLGFVEEGRKTRRLKIAPNEYLDEVYMALWGRSVESTRSSRARRRMPTAYSVSRASSRPSSGGYVAR